jgi:hypothetical protein
MLLSYAQIAGIFLEALVDDELDLPERLPANPKSEGIRRRSGKRK